MDITADDPPGNPETIYPIWLEGKALTPRSTHMRVLPHTSFTTHLHHAVVQRQGDEAEQPCHLHHGVVGEGLHGLSDGLHTAGLTSASGG